jgi:hypothetical protein
MIKICFVTSGYFIGILFEKLSSIAVLNSNWKLKAVEVTGIYCIYIDKRQISISFCPVQLEC